MFSKLSIRSSEYIEDEEHHLQVFHVYDPHALTQAVGYAKYKIAEENKSSVFLRGQSTLYQSFSPTLYRICKSEQCQQNQQNNINKYLDQLKSKNTIFSTFNSKAHEPLLQHYGIKTSWIDLVDNIWIALWFACNDAKPAGKFGEYLHFEKRESPANRIRADYSYILLIETETFNNKKEPGIHLGELTETVDLRVAVPSVFLRPHSQHGILFRSRGNSGNRPIDYINHICGIIRVDLWNALNWLGEGKLLDVHTLFPSPVYDSGYRILLENGIQDSIVGKISHIGA
ncbi:MAG: FRG domain-containing protein [Magnetococcales bacterium]|nr:FRG domain-containing protein [Magnetococcales bacterium]